MITSLTIDNYALIDHLEINFTPGLNIITGETGAGKSIILGALNLLLGARADTRAIRLSQSKSMVEGVFCVKDNPHLKHWADDEEIEWDAEECILRREISPNGRSRAFVNDSPVSLAKLAQIGQSLIDIHSQHQNQLMSQPSFQLSVIDSLAKSSELLQTYTRQFTLYRQALQRLNNTLKSIEQNKSEQEFLRFQLQQLEQAALIDGEQEELEAERTIQANMTDIKMALQDALNALSTADTSALPLISNAQDALADLADTLEDADQLSQRLESARLEIQDIAETLCDFDSNLNADPDALDHIEQRLSTLYSLQSRFKVDTVGQLISLRQEIKRKLTDIDDSEVIVRDLREEVESALSAARLTGSQLTEIRKEAAEKFKSEILATARPLGMPNLNCRINVTQAELSATGADNVEFLFSFNKNQEPTSIAGAASGGEVSRLMLALKAITADRLGLPTIIFDEVDTGVSGDVASRMAAMMLALSSQLQVITITHLPQVAAMGRQHFKVYKEDDAQATHTRIVPLDHQQRRTELALMLSGNGQDPTALAAADTLLNRK